MEKIEELKKEAEENIQKFAQELQLLNQRQNLVSQEIIKLQGEIRGFEKLLIAEKSEEQEKEKKEGKKETGKVKSEK